MADSLDDSDALPTSRFMGYLAGKPARVVAVTGAIAMVGTAALLLVGPGMGATGAISALATLWALFLALVIYLLTARDTDKLLAHIDALQDQLAAALDTPGADAEVVEGHLDEDGEGAGEQSGTAALPGAVAAASTKPAEAREPADNPAAPTLTPAGHPPQRPTSRTASAGPGLRPGATPELTERIPAPYLTALARQAGLTTQDIHRAWTPHPDGRGPWVVESDNGDRWSVFASRRGGTTVIPLGNASQQRDQGRERSRAMKRQRLDMRSGAQRAAPTGQQPGDHPEQGPDQRQDQRAGRVDTRVRPGKDPHAGQQRGPRQPTRQPRDQDPR